MAERGAGEKESCFDMLLKEIKKWEKVSFATKRMKSLIETVDILPRVQCMKLHLKQQEITLTSSEM